MYMKLIDCRMHISALTKCIFVLALDSSEVDLIKIKIVLRVFGNIINRLKSKVQN
jgi:hypothetical protein